MLEYEEALACILAVIPPVQPERVPILRAHQRILAEEILAPLDLPPFDNSAMDGYAVRAEDLAGATAESPVPLRLCGRIAAGDVFTGALAAGTCARIFTGSPIPAGADAVVMQEDTLEDPAGPGRALIRDSVKPWENVRFRGEDVKRGARVAHAGEELGLGGVSLLAALGIAEIVAGRQPVAGVLATGSELVEGGQPLPAGAIYESNRVALAALLAQAGAVPKMFPLVKDTAAGTRQALADAFASCDLVITSGGVSVGEMDFVKDAFTELGGELQFWKVAIRPGRPFVFGRWKGKFLFGLPGNPVSAFVTFLLLVRPALRRWQGAPNPGLPRQPATLSEPVVNRADRRHFVRVRVDEQGRARPSGLQASHILSSLALANGLLDVPPQTTLLAGTSVSVLRFDFQGG